MENPIESGKKTKKIFEDETEKMSKKREKNQANLDELSKPK
jgi:hypothetical protein